MKVLDFQETPVQELHYASESITSFASSGVALIGEMAARLKELLPSISMGLAGSKDVNELKDIKGLAAEEQQFLANIAKVSYAEVREFRADIPEGFAGNLKDYAYVLAIAADKLTTFPSTVLNPYVLFLAQLMSSKNAAIATDDKHSVHESLMSERKAGNDHIAQYFKLGRMEAEAKIGQVIGNNGEWKDLFIHLRQATEYINSINREEITHLLSLAVDYLNVIHQNLVEGKLENVSPEASKALADGAFQIASHIEHLALIHYRVLALTHAVKGTVERVNKILG
jgi:hypothetical protein